MTTTDSCIGGHDAAEDRDAEIARLRAALALAELDRDIFKELYERTAAELDELKRDVQHMMASSEASAMLTLKNSLILAAHAEEDRQRAEEAEARARDRHTRALVMQAFAESLGRALVAMVQEIGARPVSEWPRIMDPGLYGQGDAYLVDAAQRQRIREKFGDEVAYGAVAVLTEYFATIRPKVEARAAAFRAAPPSAD